VYHRTAVLKAEKCGTIEAQGIRLEAYRSRCGRESDFPTLAKGWRAVVTLVDSLIGWQTVIEIQPKQLDRLHNQIRQTRCRSHHKDGT
jgi:hypothetical protein